MGLPPEVDALIARVPLFARLPQGVRARLASAAGSESVPAGDVLVREGDPGDSLYVVASGRLEVSVEGEPVRILSRGDVVGELALLTTRPRTATVRAVRDSELAVIGRDAFQELLAAHPEVLAEVVELLIERLPQAGRAAPPTRDTSRRGVVTVIGTGALPNGLVTSLVDGLGTELARLTTCATVVEETAEPASWGAHLDRVEAEHDVVLLSAPLPGTSWAEFCLRQADRTLAVVSAGPGALEPETPVPDGSELVVVGRHDGSTPWLEGHVGKRHLVDPLDDRAGVRRLARRLAGRAVGLVLSGGGARGLAHLGVVEALEGAGLQIDRWGGTSMGALVAASYARGMSSEQIKVALRRELVDGRPFHDFRVPRHSLIRATRAARMLDRLLGNDRIECLDRSFFCLSCDLYTASEVVHRSGRLVDAVGASMRIPGVAPPLATQGRLLVDGGVLNNLPIDVMAEDGDGPVIAVDVMRPFGPSASPRVPSIVDTIGRSMVLGSWQKSTGTREFADLVITPELGAVGMFEFARMDDLVESGRRAATAAIEQACALRG
jgi:predicted acylesterase/phospholipase RssA